MLNKPDQSYYQHYERPVNKKIQEAATKEWLDGEARKLFNITPEVSRVPI